MNHLLEAIGRSAFRSLFIDFEGYEDLVASERAVAESVT